MTDHLISHISDTARWTAAYRATETLRPDALFHDPLASHLAGDRGRAIATGAPRMIRWWSVSRTKLIDDLVAESVDGGCDRVLNLAAGFDTRPYRLDLPAKLEWIEADLPAIIDEKQRLLKGEPARCRLSRIAVDLNDALSRRALLADATRDAQKALVITEGLLLYLSEQQVRVLADDLHRKEISAWITDLLAPSLVRRTRRQMSDLDNAPLMFEPTNGVEFFEQHGWSVGAICSIVKHARRSKRLPLVLRLAAYLPEANPRKLKHAPWSGVVRFDR